ncbi:MAG: hypothetical protein OEW24_08685, partial [Chloroflexota bacterium]|nr:hypothetical protein [Chloroflexota bacterium]
MPISRPGHRRGHRLARALPHSPHLPRWYRPGRTLARASASLAAILIGTAAAMSPGVPGQADAAVALTITPLTWNVIGLDSNGPATGPNRFPVGAR